MLDLLEVGENVGGMDMELDETVGKDKEADTSQKWSSHSLFST